MSYALYIWLKIFIQLDQCKKVVKITMLMGTFHKLSPDPSLGSNNEIHSNLILKQVVPISIVI